MSNGFPCTTVMSSYDIKHWQFALLPTIINFHKLEWFVEFWLFQIAVKNEMLYDHLVVHDFNSDINNGYRVKMGSHSHVKIPKYAALSRACLALLTIYELGD
jgi:hypothetical protein